jgi:hypothetical protein
MSNRVNISINLPKSQVRKIEDYLKTLSDTVLEKNDEKPENQRFIKGTGTKESISKLSGSWNNTAERMSANEIRKTAWQRKVRN